MQPDWTIDELAADYAWCARKAVDSGADAVETNFSCPNVATCDGQLYQHASDARLCAQVVRDAIGDTPFLVKIGHVPSAEAVDELLGALAPLVDGLVMTNSIAATVVDERGGRMFDGQPRGICGGAIRESSLAQTRRFDQRLRGATRSPQLIGVGGVFTAAHVRSYLDAGATAVHLATAAMTDPGVALTIRTQWNADT
jgi:dihydroorotate dehydrogenase